MSRQKLYTPNQLEPFAVSRSKIELFLNCPQCFYLDRRLGISRVSGPAFTLNSAVDTLLKQEFDIHRTQQTNHPLLDKYNIKLKPAQHQQINEWRENFKGVRYHHLNTNLIIYGAIDDLWIDEEGTYYVVDYKSTSKAGVVDKLEDTPWHNAYKRQMEIYQWLLRRNGLKVSDTGYFVYCNGIKDKQAFDGKLEFDVRLVAYTGTDTWVEDAIVDLHKTLNLESVPESIENCDWCRYRNKVSNLDEVKKSLGNKL